MYIQLIYGYIYECVYERERVGKVAELAATGDFELTVTESRISTEK